MSKKWVDVDQIKSAAGRSKKYTDDKIADLAGTTMDAITDLDDGKQDALWGYEGYQLTFDKEFNPVSVPISPRDNLLPGTDFSNPNEFYANWKLSSTADIMVTGNEYVAFDADGKISIDLGIDTLNAIWNKYTILSFVGTGNIDVLGVLLKGTTSSDHFHLPIHIYDITTKKQLAHDSRKCESIQTGLTGIRIEVSAEAGSRLYGIKLEIGSTQTLAHYDYTNGYELISQYPVHVINADLSNKYVPVPSRSDFSAGKGPGNVVAYDDKGNTKFQHVTAGQNYLKNSIFLELGSYEWPENWERSSTDIHLAGTTVGGLAARPQVYFEASGTISTSIPLDEFPLFNTTFTVSVLGKSGFALQVSIRHGNETQPFDKPFFDAVEYDKAATLHAERPHQPADYSTGGVISVTGRIEQSIPVKDRHEYTLHINVAGYAESNLRSLTSIWAIKLESGYNQTLAYLHSTSGFKEMRLIPQLPYINDPSEIITGQNICPESDPTKLIYQYELNDERIKFLGWILGGNYQQIYDEYNKPIGIKVTPKEGTNYALIDSYIDHSGKINELKDRIITCSALIAKHGSLTVSSHVVNNDGSVLQTDFKTESNIKDDNIELVTVTSYVHNTNNSSIIGIHALRIYVEGISSEDYICIYDFKIEYGEKSTLCNKFNNTYVSNGIPGNRPENILAFGLPKTTTNLIKNGYFSKKLLLNTQGQTTYISTNKGVDATDNWYLWAYEGGISKLTLYNDFISIEPQVDNIQACFYTYLSTHNIPKLTALMPYTISWYCVSVGSKPYSISINCRNSDYTTITGYIIVYEGIDIGYTEKTLYLPITPNVEKIEIGIDAGSTTNIAFINMTLGFHQTSYDKTYNLNFEYVNSYDFGAITIPQSTDKIVGYNENGRLVPVPISDVLSGGASTLSSWHVDCPLLSCCIFTGRIADAVAGTVIDLYATFQSIDPIPDEVIANPYDYVFAFRNNCHFRVRFGMADGTAREMNNIVSFPVTGASKHFIELSFHDSSYISSGIIHTCTPAYIYAESDSTKIAPIIVLKHI